MEVSGLREGFVLKGECSCMNQEYDESFVFSIRVCPACHDHSPKTPNLLEKTTPAGPLGRSRRHHSGSRRSRFGEGRGAAFHHGTGGREGRSQRRIEEWRQTGELLRGILEDEGKPPFVRLRVLVHAFIRSECEEARMRVALNDAAPLYRDAPEAREARAAGERTVQVFLKEVLPKASKATRTLAGALIATTLGAAGKDFSESPRTAVEIEAYADAMTDMFCAYLAGLGHADTASQRNG
jgi:hypothetical protein